MTVLLLDVMDTIVWDPVRLLPAFFGEASWEALWPARHPTAWVDFEHGRIDEATFLSRFFADGRSYDQQGLRRTMFENYRFLPGMEALLAELAAAGVAMHALSNYPSWWEEIEARLRLSRFLSWSFVSCQTGLRKPSPESYLGASLSLALPGSELLFVDDRQKNVDAAQAAGLGGLRFIDAVQLRADLVARGILGT